MTDDIQTRIAHLSRRLEDGWQRLDAAERAGDRRFRDWEDFFIKLLKEYEILVDEAEAQADAVEQASLL
jgi:hypothetical protein